MDKSKHRSRSTMYFGALVSMLAFAIAIPWFIDPFEFIAPRQTVVANGLSEDVAALPELMSRPRPKVEHFGAIVERPLFIASRRPATAIVSSKRADPILKQYRLTGVMMAPEKRVVFLAGKRKGENLALKIGDELHGWLVAEIERRRVVFVSMSDRQRYVIGSEAQP